MPFSYLFMQSLLWCMLLNNWFSLKFVFLYFSYPFRLFIYINIRIQFSSVFSFLVYSSHQKVLFSYSFSSSRMCCFSCISLFLALCHRHQSWWPHRAVLQCFYRSKNQFAMYLTKFVIPLLVSSLFILVLCYFKVVMWFLFQINRGNLWLQWKLSIWQMRQH